ncbi:hypothetical protein Q0Z83_059990 [Actinoplanes sichuanensis]|uniref:Uncharacterized protein n=1 Tax=Actinoplanes sichuanensis TaxID=512349 RepID=A0ABW4A6P4_9ACTN|nr:hypothetical protein [Actinoplanes sichuanensis]BEL07808.1 hypothetical protein Q0Z83_059990 [Actinoplanes sichuanensis]
MSGVEPTEQVKAWVQAIADRDHGGNRAAAIVAILTAAYESEQAPDNLWAYQEARMRHGPQVRPRK